MSEKWKKRAHKAFIIAFWLSWAIWLIYQEIRYEYPNYTVIPFDRDIFDRNFTSFIAAFLIALIPCSFVSLIQNRDSVIRLLFKIPVYAFYLSVVAMAVVFIILLPFYLCGNTSKIGVGLLAVVPFVSVLFVAWALIMLFMLLRDRILSRRRN
jgi:hypothetical protein